MSILILAYTPETYATQKLMVHFNEMGIEAKIASPLDCIQGYEAGISSLTVKGERLDGIRAVILRGLTYYHNGVLVPRETEASIGRMLANDGVLCFNSPESKLVAANKLTSIQKLSSWKISVPRTIATWTSEGFDLAVSVLGTPLIIKLLDSTWGSGVMLCDSLEAAKSAFDVLRTTGAAFLLQEYIPSSDSASIRVLVVGGVIVAAVLSTPQNGEFRSNVAKGSKLMAYDPPADIQELALSATACIGLDISGVDIIVADEKPKVLEVNSVPGLEAIDKACRVDSAKVIARYIAEKMEAASCAATRR